MNQVMQQLFELQSLEFGQVISPANEARMAELRTKIPAPILAHYDRLAVRGKKGVALLQRQTCSGCHVRVPRNVVLELNRGLDVRICESCSRYLYLREADAEDCLVTSQKATPKSGRKPLAVVR